MAVFDRVSFFQLVYKLHKGKKFYFLASSTSKIKCGKAKGMQENGCMVMVKLCKLDINVKN